MSIHPYNTCITQLPLIVLALSAHGYSGEPKEQSLKDIGFHGGSVFEVKFEDEQQSPVLFRFHKDGRFDFMDSTVVFLLDGAHWRVEGERFRIETAKNLDWEANGTISGDRLTGIRRRSANGEMKKFSGTKIDYSAYQFPLKPNEVIVEMRLQSYVYDWDFPDPNELERYVGAEDDLAISDDEVIHGFIFKVTRPKKYEGQFVTSHHDGTLPSGSASAIAQLGKTYLWRTDSRVIGKRDFSVCSIALHWMKEASDDSDDPRYRPWFVQIPKARAQDSK